MQAGDDAVNPIYTIIEINDGGDPECDIDSTTVRCLYDGVGTEIRRVVYTGIHVVTRFEFSNDEGFAELLCGTPCTVREWNEILAEFKEAVARLPC